MADKRTAGLLVIFLEILAISLPEFPNRLSNYTELLQRSSVYIMHQLPDKPSHLSPSCLQLWLLVEEVVDKLLLRAGLLRQHLDCEQGSLVLVLRQAQLHPVEVLALPVELGQPV